MPFDERRSEKRFEDKRERDRRAKAGIPGADEEPLPPPVQPVKNEKKDIGRNDPCPCGSGKKYKKCCGK